MKIGLLLLPVIGSAALAATQDTAWGIGRLWRAEPLSVTAMPRVDPPWLTKDAASDSPDLQASAPLEADDDPHAGLFADDDDPYAGLCTDDDDPYASLCAADDDPHAGLFADDDDPYAEHVLHLGAAAAHDPHAQLPVEHDPHLQSRYGQDGPAAVATPRSKAANGRSVAEIFSQRTTLNQKLVMLRATVVKVTDGILGKTYLHLRDGSGTSEEGNNDLTATTTEVFEVGETVELEGRLAIDQDVGLDYRYAALLTLARRAPPTDAANPPLRSDPRGTR